MRRTPSMQPRPRVERRLALDGPRATIEALAVRGALGSIAFGPARKTDVREVYYDSPGGELAGGGVTLSVSAPAGHFAQRVEERRGPLAAGFAERAFSEVRLVTSEPDPAHSARVRDLCGENALIAQLEVEGAVTTRRIGFERAAIVLRLEVGEARSAAGGSRWGTRRAWSAGWRRAPA